MYKVIERFMDLQDDNYIYEVGDAYPREGADPTLERIRELESNVDKNVQNSNGISFSFLE